VTLCIDLAGLFDTIGNEVVATIPTRISVQQKVS
jgi:hypothetical protein